MAARPPRTTPSSAPTSCRSGNRTIARSTAAPAPTSSRMTARRSFPAIRFPTTRNLALGDTYVWLYAADHQAADATRATKLGNALKSHLATQHNNTAYVWRCADRLLPGDYSSNSSPENLSHANVNIHFVIDAYQNGLVFNATDLTRFSSTLTNVMWNQSLTNPVVVQYVNGTGNSSMSQYLFWWTGLAACSPEAHLGGRRRGPRTRRTLVHGLAPTAMLAASELVATLYQGGLLTQNGSFETAAAGDASLPLGWTRTAFLSQTVRRDSTHHATGNWGLALSTLPSFSFQGLQQISPRTFPMPRPRLLSRGLPAERGPSAASRSTTRPPPSHC